MRTLFRFGSISNETEARALTRMGTYHAIREAVSIPAILLVHGVNDIRVDVWQSAEVRRAVADRDNERQAGLDAA